jgi:hypothetical protein
MTFVTKNGFAEWRQPVKRRRLDYKKASSLQQLIKMQFDLFENKFSPLYKARIG